MKVGVLIFLALSACSASTTPVDRVSLGQLEFSVPAGWTASSSEGRATSTTWSPSENPNKETLSVTRTRPLEAITKAGQPAIERLLADAQKTLHDTSGFGVPIRFTTPSRMPGVKVEGNFVPPGQTRSYHRVHAVVVDGAADGALVHIIYTAATPDSEPMQVVLGSLSRKDV